MSLLHLETDCFDGKPKSQDENVRDVWAHRVENIWHICHLVVGAFFYYLLVVSPLQLETDSFVGKPKSQDENVERCFSG